jgi:hypothetical protein
MDSSIFNIIINQVIREGKKTIIKEISPYSIVDTPPLVLGIDDQNKLCWYPYKNSSSNLFEGEKIKDTEIYWSKGRMGLGRSPILSYQFDIAVSENAISTALHIGDGKCGFSMGNGTNQGFLPEIIGMGKNEYDSGLYFLGRAGNNLNSGIPLIVIDGRSHSDLALNNRPIFGITSANYNQYKLIVDYNGNVGIGKIPEIYKLEVDGDISSKDLILNGKSISSLIEIIKEHEIKINGLENQIKSLTKIRNKIKGNE